MRLVFFGSSDFAYPSLKALIHSRHQIKGVITQPDRPKGRGRQIHPLSVKTLALEKGLGVEQPQKASSPRNIEFIRHIKPDIIVVVAYGQILSRDLLAIPTHGCLNVHGSLLPKYRGASPINWAIIEGEEKTGISTIQMDEGMDTGDILLQREIPILPEDTSGSLFKRMAQLGAEVLLETLTFYETGNVVRLKQNEELATYTRLLKKEDGLIDWSQKAERICRLIRGVSPWPGAFSYLNGCRIKLLQAKMIDQGGGDCPGQILRVNRGDGLVITAGGNTLVGITLLQPENKRAMTAWEYVQGFRGNKLEGKCWSSDFSPRSK